MKTKEMIKKLIIKPILAINLIILGAFFLYVTYFLLNHPMTGGNISIKIVIAISMLLNSIVMFIFSGEVTKLIGKYALESFKGMAQLPIEPMSKGAKYVRNVIVSTIIGWVIMILILEKIVITDYPMWVFIVYNVIFAFNVFLAVYANHIVKYKVN